MSADLVRRHRAEACIGCGRCTYACVAAQRCETFSPRKIVEEALDRKRVENAPGLWACTSCGACSQVCNADVDFPELVRELRSVARKDQLPCPAHHGIMGRVVKMTARTDLVPRKADWVTPDLELDENSDTLLFVGCTPYFDVVLNYIRQDLLEIPRSAVRLLNAAGIRPRILSSERCCGHDAYWAGDDALFQKLARANIDEVRKLGVKRIVAFCPECVSCWKDLYPRLEKDLHIETKSVVEVVSEAVAAGTLKLRQGEEILTYQDPCFFSKGAGVVEQPRRVIRSVGRLEDMPRSREMSACCGTAGWVECDHTAKKVQMERLKEAADTGAGTLLTACPKCLIHLSCADKHHGAEMAKRIKLEDIHVRAAKALVR